VPIIDINYLSAAGFYCTNWSDVVRCAFCGAEVGQWKGYNAFRVHPCWSPTCGFIKGLFLGNIPIGSDGQHGTSSLLSQETSRNYNVYVPFMELRPNVCSERCKYNYLYFGFYVYVIYSSIKNFNVFLQV
jgi:hypothetical protein